MVFKKPYAFLIKHFKLIHLAILACLIFILITISDINNLFVTLQKTNTLMYAGAEVYVNNFIFVFIFIVLILTGIMYWLLHEKKKPTIIYLLLLIYVALLIPGYSYVYSVLRTMVEEVISTDLLIFLKDITFIIELPLYPFIFITFIRGIGFNLKQFNFSKDIKELQIQDEDNEEIEVNFGQNNYKYFRFIRRSFREIKYYILENKFAISVVLSLVGIVLLFIGINFYNEYLKEIKNSEATNVNGITYTVRNSYVTEYDSTGNVVNDLYKYVVVYMSFHNSLNNYKAVDLDLITLSNGKLYYHPTLTKTSKFYDLGSSYNRGDLLAPGETVNGILTFEIPKNARIFDLQLRVRYKTEDKTSTVISKYRKFDISPKKIDKKKSSSEVKLGDKISINPVDVNKFDLTINSYKLVDNYDNKYVLCSSVDKCTPLSNLITADQKEYNTMLVIDYDSVLYEDNRFSETLNTYNKIFENYMKISYELNNKEYLENVKVVTNSDVDNKLFILVDRRIIKAKNLKLIFNFRNDEFIVPLINK